MSKKTKTNFWEYLFNFLDLYHQNRIIISLKFLKIDNVIDVGSHKGEFLSYILKLRSVKRIFAFEPQIAIFKILSKKFNHKKIKFFNLALDKQISKKYIFINKFSNTSTLSIFDKKSFYLKFKNFLTGSKKNFLYKYLVKTNTIDNLFKRIRLNNTLLKIDVEGFELNVLKGGKKKILNEIDYVLIENQFVNLYQKSSSKKNHEFLIKNNFQIHKNFIHPLMIFSDCLYIKKKNR
jgi:FkbM family methyltransferase